MPDDSLRVSYEAMMKQFGIESPAAGEGVFKSVPTPRGAEINNKAPPPRGAEINNKPPPPPWWDLRAIKGSLFLIEG